MLQRSFQVDAVVLVLNDEDVKSLLSMDACIEAIEEAYRELAVGRATNAPRRETLVPTSNPEAYYVFKTMEGALQGRGVLAQRINSDMLTWPVVEGAMRRVKVPAAMGSRYVGLVFLYSTESLELLAILNDGHLQRMRVAGTSAVGAKYLARRDARSVALFGTGWQAETQLAAMCTVRDITIAKVYSPNASHRRSFAEQMGKSLGIDAVAVDEPVEAVRGSDIVNTATNSESPVCRGEWVGDGMHLTCIRATEFDGEAWNKSHLIVYTALPSVVERYSVGDLGNVPIFRKRNMTRGESAGNEFFANYQGKMRPLTDLLLKRLPTRERDSQITLMYKGIGLGIEFAATSKRVFDLARGKGLGKEIPSEWFTQSSHP